MLLKHILSNVNIPNLLDQIKIFFKKEHFLNIEETIQKFLACSLEKSFIIYQCPLCSSTHKFKVTCKSRFCPSCGIISLFGLKKLLALSLMSNTELFFLLFQKNLENFSSMIEIFLQKTYICC